MLKAVLTIMLCCFFPGIKSQENNYLTDHIPASSPACSDAVMYVGYNGKIIGMYSFPHNGRLLVEAQDYKNKELTVALYDSLSAKVFEKKVYVSDNMYTFELCRNNKGKYNVKFKVKKEVNSRRVIVL
jgi:hypothetical protein